MPPAAALALSGLLAWSAESPTPLADWYVDAGAANCAAGSGTAVAPFCTIAEAITAAVNGDTVRIAPGTYVESLTIGEDLRLIGTNGQALTFVDGGGTDRVFEILAGATVTIEGLTIRNGRAIKGGGIQSHGSLTLRNSTLSGNEALAWCPAVSTCPSASTHGTSEGGGLAVQPGAGPTTLVNSMISNNRLAAAYDRFGAGIAAGGADQLTIVDCVLSGNQGGWYGVAVHARDTPLRIRGSTVTGNTGGGAAIWTEGDRFELVNSTVSGNLGVGLRTLSSAGSPGIALESVTVTANYAYISRGAGWFHLGNLPAEIHNSVIAGNGPAPMGPTDTEVFGLFTSLGHNFIGHAEAGSAFNAPGDQVGSFANQLDPQLGPLAANGGPTETQAPLGGSPLIDAADPAPSESTDQRGYGRVGVADIGAHESGASGGPAVAGCTSTPNSSGVAGGMSAAGSTSVSANAMTLSASSLPANALAIFLTSLTPGFAANPGGSSGNLCLGGSIGRFVGPGQILDTGANGAMALAIDLDRHPTPGGLVPVMPGDTWYFQAWHRDSAAGVATSNFAAATQVTFTQ